MKVLSSLGLAIVLAATAGCVQVEHILTLERDGGGLFDMRYAVREAFFSESSIPLDPTDGAADATDRDSTKPSAVPFTLDTIRDDFEQYRPLGIQVLHAEESFENGWRRFRVMIRFESLEALNQTALYAHRTWSLEQTASGDYRLKQVPARKVASSGFNLSDPAADAELTRRLREFRARLKIQVPGDILETNGHHHDARSAAWMYDGSSGPEAFQRMNQAIQEIVMAGDGLSLPEVGQRHIRLSLDQP